MGVPLPPSFRTVEHDATTLAAPYGLTSYIVPEAGEEGGQPGWHHKQVAKLVHVDPYMQGGFVLEPSRLTKEAAQQAAAQYDVRQPGTSVEARRDIALQAIASMAGHAVPVGPVGVTVAQAPPAPIPPLGQAMPQPTEFAPPLGQPAYPPMQYNQPQAAWPAPSPAAPPQPVPMVTNPYGVTSMLPAVPVSLFNRHPMPQKVAPPPTTERPPAGPPLVEVKFEIEGAGYPIAANFHDVLVRGSTLVLVFDTRAVGYPRNFPPIADKRRLAMEIVGKGQTFFCAAEGRHQFQFENYELCVLEISQAGE